MQQLFEWGGGMWGGIGLAVLQILAFVIILLVRNFYFLYKILMKGFIVV